MRNAIALLSLLVVVSADLIFNVPVQGQHHDHIQQMIKSATTDKQGSSIYDNCQSQLEAISYACLHIASTQGCPNSQGDGYCCSYLSNYYSMGCPVDRVSAALNVSFSGCAYQPQYMSNWFVDTCYRQNHIRYDGCLNCHFSKLNGTTGSGCFRGSSTATACQSCTGADSNRCLSCPTGYKVNPVNSDCTGPCVPMSTVTNTCIGTCDFYCTPLSDSEKANYTCENCLRNTGISYGDGCDSSCTACYYDDGRHSPNRCLGCQSGYEVRVNGSDCSGYCVPTGSAGSFGQNYHTCQNMPCAGSCFGNNDNNNNNNNNNTNNNDNYNCDQGFYDMTYYCGYSNGQGNTCVNNNFTPSCCKVISEYFTHGCPDDLYARANTSFDTCPYRPQYISNLFVNQCYKPGYLGNDDCIGCYVYNRSISTGENCFKGNSDHPIGCSACQNSSWNACILCPAGYDVQPVNADCSGYCVPRDLINYTNVHCNDVCNGVCENNNNNSNNNNNNHTTNYTCDQMLQSAISSCSYWSSGM